MARAKWTKSSRKPHICGRGHEIPVGEGYYSAAPGFRGRTLYRCQAHPFRPSELTIGMRAAPLSALEALEDAIPELGADGYDRADDYDSLRSAVEEFASEIRSYAEDRRYALDEWPNGNSMLEELQYTAEQAADEAESIADDIEEFDIEEPERADYADGEDGQGEWTDAYEQWDADRDQHWEDTVEAAMDAAQSIEF